MKLDESLENNIVVVPHVGSAHANATLIPRRLPVRAESSRFCDEVVE